MVVPSYFPVFLYYITLYYPIVSPLTKSIGRFDHAKEWQGELQWLRGQGLLDETDYIPPEKDPESKT